MIVRLNSGDTRNGGEFYPGRFVSPHWRCHAPESNFLKLYFHSDESLRVEIHQLPSFLSLSFLYTKGTPSSPCNGGRSPPQLRPFFSFTRLALKKKKKRILRNESASDPSGHNNNNILDNFFLPNLINFNCCRWSRNLVDTTNTNFYIFFEKKERIRLLSCLRHYSTKINREITEIRL